MYYVHCAWNKNFVPSEWSPLVVYYVCILRMIRRIIRRSFIYLDADILLPLYKALVRSHFDYAMIIWNPHMVT